MPRPLDPGRAGPATRRLALRALNRRLSQAFGYALLGFLAVAAASAAILAEIGPPRRLALAALALLLAALILWRAIADLSRLRRIAARRRRN